ncbi:MAG: thiamine pyrophosphate-dependent enzyme [Haliea sp.]|uniref:thiamine pyrophosphate-dependent enzyme n=1 Tax=Haliea sp. TaxID=1932666 RepID=UPI0032EB22A0
MTVGSGRVEGIHEQTCSQQHLYFPYTCDGSLNMTIHELVTCHRHGIGVKAVVINNQWLGMVRQWQDMIFDGHRSGSDLSDPLALKAPREVDIYPDFPTITEGYRVRAERVSAPAELPAAFLRMLENPDKPYLLDVIVDGAENVYPMIPADGTYRGIILGSGPIRT